MRYKKTADNYLLFYFCLDVAKVNIVPATPLTKIYLIIVIEKAGDSPVRGNVAVRQKGCRPRLAIEPW